jgi:uncharacterized protein YkwD
MSFTMPIRAGFAAAIITALLAAVATLAPQPDAVFAAPAKKAKAQTCRGADTWTSTKRARKALLCLVNRERAKRGLRKMRYSSKLSKVAAVHAGDLVRYRFIGHTSPRHGGLMKRVKKSGWAAGKSRWTYGEIMGDGLNRGATPRRIVRAWMNRPIHSRAILHRRFTSMGVGAVKGRPRGRAAKSRTRTYVMTFAG